MQPCSRWRKRNTDMDMVKYECSRWRKRKIDMDLVKYVRGVGYSSTIKRNKNMYTLM